jgi:hypothetical protein
VRGGQDWNVMGPPRDDLLRRPVRRRGGRPCLVTSGWQGFEAPRQLGARTQLVHTAVQVRIAGAR